MHTPIWVSIKAPAIWVSVEHPLPTRTAALLPHLHPRQRPRYRLHLLPQPRSNRLRSLLPPVLVSRTAGTAPADTVQAAEHAAGDITGTQNCIRFRLQMVQGEVKQISQPLTRLPRKQARRARRKAGREVWRQGRTDMSKSLLHLSTHTPTILACAAASSAGSCPGRVSPLSPSEPVDRA